MAKSKQLFGKAPLTIVRTNSGSAVYVYKGRPAPGDISAEERTRLLDEGYLVEREVDEAPAADDDSGSNAGDQTVAGVLEAVGNDPEKAAAALEAEKAGKNRSSLVSKLEAIANTVE